MPQVCKGNGARIFKLSRSPGIDSKELIPSAYAAWQACTTTQFILYTIGLNSSAVNGYFLKSPTIKVVHSVNVQLIFSIFCCFAVKNQIHSISIEVQSGHLPWKPVSAEKKFAYGHETVGSGICLSIEVANHACSTHHVLVRVLFYFCFLNPLLSQITVISEKCTVHVLQARVWRKRLEKSGHQPPGLSPQHPSMYLEIREYWMTYRGTGFLAVVYDWFLLYPSPFKKLPLFLSLPVCRWSGDGEG